MYIAIATIAITYAHKYIVHVCITTAVLHYELSAVLLCSPSATLAYINGHGHLDMLTAAGNRWW